MGIFSATAGIGFHILLLDSKRERERDGERGRVGERKIERGRVAERERGWERERERGTEKAHVENEMTSQEGSLAVSGPCPLAAEASKSVGKLIDILKLCFGAEPGTILKSI